MKKIYWFVFMLLMMSPMYVSASEGEDVSTTKYYKTITVVNAGDNILYSMVNNNSYTEEITEEEYNNYDPNSIIVPLGYSDGYTETTYKKMTSSITKNGTKYRYKVVLDWKTMPSTRSYDIIGIGFPASVEPGFSATFNQNYCYTNGDCYTSVAHTPYVGVNGVGASFSLPSGSLVSLRQTLYADMIKSDSTSTIVAQYAYGDYSHATSSISSSNATRYVVSAGGIVLESAIEGYYDEINKATATWTGTW